MASLNDDNRLPTPSRVFVDPGRKRGCATYACRGSPQSGDSDSESDGRFGERPIASLIAFGRAADPAGRRATTAATLGATAKGGVQQRPCPVAGHAQENGRGGKTTIGAKKGYLPQVGLDWNVHLGEEESPH